MPDTNSVAELIRKKGGTAEFARATGRTMNALRVWRCRNRIPREAWPEIQIAFPDVTVQKLLMMERATTKGEKDAR